MWESAGAMAHVEVRNDFEESVPFPPVMWIPVIKVRSPDLYVSVFPAEPTLPQWLSTAF